MRRVGARGEVVTLILTGAWILGSLISGGAAPADVIREGTIDGVKGDGITVAVAGAGVTPVKISATTTFRSRQKTTVETIKPGDYVGVAARRGSDGTLTAVAINIFPPEFKDRIREGQFPMASGDIMTNATVMEYAVKVENRTLFLKYKDGASAITVPPTAEVYRLAVIRLSNLHAGMRVSIRGQMEGDGSITASSILVDQP
jgi:hypothetical protein